MRLVMKTLIVSLCLSCLSGCLYRSPEDGEVSTNPTTNNPSLGPVNKDSDMMPGIRY